MSRGPRQSVLLPTDKVRAAGELARAHGTPLSAYLRAEITYTARRAAAGDTRGLPPVPPRAPAGSRPLTRVDYPGASDEARECRAIFAEHGSSVAAVAEAALDAYVAAGGRWLDAQGPALPPAVLGACRAA